MFKNTQKHVRNEACKTFACKTFTFSWKAFMIHQEMCAIHIYKECVRS